MVWRLFYLIAFWGEKKVTVFHVISDSSRKHIQCLNVDFNSASFELYPLNILSIACGFLN